MYDMGGIVRICSWAARELLLPWQSEPQCGELYTYAYTRKLVWYIGSYQCQCEVCLATCSESDGTLLFGGVSVCVCVW